MKETSGKVGLNSQFGIIKLRDISCRMSF